jgi:hypothetical protein
MYIIWYKVLFTVFRANIKIIFGGLVFTVTCHTTVSKNNYYMETKKT